jgi:hypothetical protein
MVSAGPYIRHAAAVIVGIFFTWLVDLLPWITTYVPEEQIVGIQDALVGFITLTGLVVFGVVYAWAEKFLKRFGWIDPQGFTDRLWLKNRANINSGQRGTK